MDEHAVLLLGRGRRRGDVILTMHYLLPGLIGLLLVYLIVRMAIASRTKSRCCNARVNYQLGWSYKEDGNVCSACGMLQD